MQEFVELKQVPADLLCPCSKASTTKESALVIWLLPLVVFHVTVMASSILVAVAAEGG